MGYVGKELKNSKIVSLPDKSDMFRMAYMYNLLSKPIYERTHIKWKYIFHVTWPGLELTSYRFPSPRTQESTTLPFELYIKHVYK